MRFIWSLIGIIIGIILLWKTYQLVNWFGKVDWAERHLAGGFGGTYFLYKAIGLLLIIFSLMYMFGALDIFLLPLGKIFGGVKTGR